MAMATRYGCCVRESRGVPNRPVSANVLQARFSTGILGGIGKQDAYRPLLIGSVPSTMPVMPRRWAIWGTAVLLQICP